MIKYNETYRINNGKETIVFSTGNDNIVTGNIILVKDLNLENEEG